MKLVDQIMDDAQELAESRTLPPVATRQEIAEAISQMVNVRIDPNSSFGKLAEAAYNRHANIYQAA